MKPGGEMLHWLIFHSLRPNLPKSAFSISDQLWELKAGGSFFPSVPGAAAGRNRSATGSIASAPKRGCRPDGCCCEPLSQCNLLPFSTAPCSLGIPPFFYPFYSARRHLLCGICLGSCLFYFFQKQKGRIVSSIVSSLSQGKLVPCFKPWVFKLNLARLDEPLVTRMCYMPLLHHLLFSEVTWFPHTWSCNKQINADRCLPLLPVKSWKTPSCWCHHP